MMSSRVSTTVRYLSTAVQVLFLLSLASKQALADSGTATYSSTDASGAAWGCDGLTSSLPSVAINAEQFGGGAACGKCVLANGVTYQVTNVLTQGNSGDLNFPNGGSGADAIKWDFVGCPTASSSPPPAVTAAEALSPPSKNAETSPSPSPSPSTSPCPDDSPSPQASPSPASQATPRAASDPGKQPPVMSSAQGASSPPRRLALF